MTPQARQIINDVAQKRHLSPSAILGRRRINSLMHARIEIAKRLSSDRGYSHHQIAAILNRDHTTICFYLGGLNRKKPAPEKTPYYVSLNGCLAAKERQ